MDKADDQIAWGAKGIAPIINRTERQTFHMLEANLLPAVKIGGKWAATKSALMAAFAKPIPKVEG